MVLELTDYRINKIAEILANDVCAADRLEHVALTLGIFGASFTDFISKNEKSIINKKWYNLLQIWKGRNSAPTIPDLIERISDIKDLTNCRGKLLNYSWECLSRSKTPSSKILFAQNSQVQNHAERPTGILFNVRILPYPHLPRGQDLVNLHNILKNSQRRIAYIHGIAGIGKTTLALIYASQNADCLDGNIIWIDASSRETIQNSFEELVETKLKKELEKFINFGQVYNHFKGQKSLFIFDNLHKDMDFRHFLPLNMDSSDGVNKPYILATGRKFLSHQTVKFYHLKPIDDSLEFITNSLNFKREDVKSIEILAGLLLPKLLGIPLAIQQAVCHIRHLEIKYRFEFPKPNILQIYLAIWSENLKKVLNFKYFKKNFDFYKETVYSSWTGTLKTVALDLKCGESAGIILRISAYFCPYKIPVKCFEGFGTDAKLQKSLNLLQSYSLIEREALFFSVLSLLQNVVRVSNSEIPGMELDILKKCIDISKLEVASEPHVQAILQHSLNCNSLRHTEPI